MRAILIGTFFFVSTSLMAEVVKLKNGTVIRGDVEMMTPTDILMKTENIGKVLIKRSEIDSVSDMSLENKAVPNLSAGSGSFGTVSPNIEVVNSAISNYKNNSKWLFGLGLGVAYIPGQHFGGPGTYEITPIGYRFQNGFELSASVELDMDFQNPKIDPDDFSDDEVWDNGYRTDNFKKLSISASYPILKWRMLGSHNEIKANLKVGVVDTVSHDGGYGFIDYSYDMSENRIEFYEVQGLTTDIGLHYSLRLMSFLDINIGGGVGMVPHKFKDSRYEITWQDGGEKKKTNLDSIENSTTSHFYTGLRILL